MIFSVIMIYPPVLSGETSDMPHAMDSILSPEKTTSWSRPMEGLSLRIIYHPIVRYGDSITIEYEIRYTDEEIESPVSLNESGFDSLQCRLRLTDKTVNAEYVFNASNIISDSVKHGNERSANIVKGRCVFKVEKDIRGGKLRKRRRNPFYTWKTPRADTSTKSLPVGDYDVQLELFLTGRDSTSGNKLVISNPFEIEISHEDGINTERTFLFPKALRVSRGPLIDWDRDDMDTVTLTIDPGYDLQFQCLSVYGDLSAPGLPEFPVVLLNRDIPAGFIHPQLLLKPKKRPVFVDGKATLDFRFILMSCFSANGRVRGYRPSEKIWEKEMSVDISEEEYDSLYIPETELYDYRTLIVPKVLRIGVDDSLRFEGADAGLIEVRYPRHEHISSRICIGGNNILLRRRLPESPLMKLPEVGPNSVIPIKIEIFCGEPDTCAVCDGDTLDAGLLWSGEGEITNFGHEFEITETFVCEIPEKWPLRTYYIPRELLFNENSELIPDTSNSIRITIIREPGTALLARIATGNDRISSLPPDFKGGPIRLNSGSLQGDTLRCRFELYESPVGQTDYGGHEPFWTRNYLIPLTKKQVKHVRELNNNRKNSWGRFPSGTVIR